eukprot:72997_1
MLVLGGCKLDIEREAIDSIEIIQQNHHSILSTKLHTPVRGATSHVIDGYLFVVGGCKGPKQHLNTVQFIAIDGLITEEKEQLRNTWFRLNKERSSHISAYSEKQQKLFVLGGFDGRECLDSIEVLDLTDFKKRITDAKVDNKKSNLFQDFDDLKINSNFGKFGKLPNRLKNSACVMNENNQNIYTFGGWDEKNTLDSVWSISTYDGKYHFIGFLPHKSEGHAIVYIAESGSVFIFGGFDGFAVTNRIMKFNINTGASCLVDGQRLSEARENLVAQRIDRDHIIVSSGWNGRESSSVIDTFQYDCKKDSIQRIDSKQELQIKRNRPTSIVI